MTKEEIEQIFELGADAQYRYWNPEGDADVEGFDKAKQEAVKLFFIHDVRNSLSEETLPDECKPGTHDWDYNINPYQKTCKKCNVRYLA